MNSRLLAWGVLLLAALLLRGWGLGFGSPPTLIHPDESHYSKIAGALSWDDLDPHYFENPPLLTYLLFAAREAHAVVSGAEANRQWIDDGGLVRLARWIAVLSGSATVLLVGAAAWRLLGSPGTALAAGAVVAFSFLHGRDSHYGVNDVPMVALLSLSLYAAARAQTQLSRRWLWSSAIAAGLAAAMKYSGGVAIALPLAVVATRPATRAARLREAGLALLLAAAAFLLTNPWPLLAPEEFGAGFRNQWSGWGDRRMVGQADRPLVSLYGEGCLSMLGLPHAVAAAAGVLLLLRRDRRSAAILLAAPVLYLAVMLNKTLFYWRFALPLLPFLAVAAGVGWDALARRLSAASRLAAPVALALLVVPASLPPAIALARHDWLANRPSTWLLARQWIIEHVPPGETLYLEGLPPRLPAGRYRVLLADAPRTELRDPTSTGADGQGLPSLAQGVWVVTDSWFEASWQRAGRSPDSAGFDERLRRAFQPVAEFRPGPDGDPPFIVDAIYTPLTDLWAIDRPGFTIRVYRLGPDEWRRLLPP